MTLIDFNSDDIRDCETLLQLATLLEIDVKKLLFFAYKNNKLYSHYKIKKKSGGEREISAPTEGLKAICKKLATLLGAVYYENLPISVHGFVSDRDIVTNAQKHLSRKYVLNIDLENFFGTINAGRIMGLLRNYPFNFNKLLASVVAGIVTHKNSLPQGAPTSPVLSNMICRKMDKEFMNLARLNNWVYSRYADDITISSNILNDNLASKTDGGFAPSEMILQIISRNGFSIKVEKTRLASPNQAKWVTGVKVNDDLNVSRKFIRVVRSLLHTLENLKNAGSNLSSAAELRMLQVVRGKIAHIGHVKTTNNITYIRLYNRWCNLSDYTYERIPESPKEDYMDKVLLIVAKSGVGAGFFISKNIVVTAAHLLLEEERVVKITTRKRRMPAEYISAGVVAVYKETDLAILHVSKSEAANFEGATFGTDFNYRNYDHDTDYVAIGYGGFRSGGTLWTEPSVVDQKIVQVENSDFYRVDKPMWKGMSGGPVISQKTGLVVGYIVYGSQTLADGYGHSNIFRPISNVPVGFRPTQENFNTSNIIQF